ncbi:MAG TPA: hypothetical protein VE758_10540 [Chthoniobacterales bacterium]|nr:hypothetical protein [Chthoniobacterales bacterium]
MPDATLAKITEFSYCNAPPQDGYKCGENQTPQIETAGLTSHESRRFSSPGARRSQRRGPYKDFRTAGHQLSDAPHAYDFFCEKKHG